MLVRNSVPCINKDRDERHLVLSMCQKFIDGPALTLEALSNLYVDKEQWLSSFRWSDRKMGGNFRNTQTFTKTRGSGGGIPSWQQLCGSAQSCWNVRFKWLCETSGCVSYPFLGLGSVSAMFSHATWGLIRGATAMSRCCRITTRHAHAVDYVRARQFQMKGRCM